MDNTSRPQSGLQSSHRRSKSSTSVLKSMISSRSQPKTTTKGKENTTPPPSAGVDFTPPTPIWAEFSTKGSQRPKSQVLSSKTPLGDRIIEQEINLYTPKDHSPTKQKQNSQHARPTLMQQSRPKSAILEKSKSAINVFDSLNRTASDDVVPTKRSSAYISKTFGRTTGLATMKAQKESEKAKKSARSTSKDFLTMAKKGTRVMELVAAFNSKSDEANSEKLADPKEIDAAFETLLESRNIPENMRSNLRTLKHTVKANLIKSNDFDLGSMSKAKSAPSSVKDKVATSPTTPSTPAETDVSIEDPKKSAKRTRARSKTFTFSRSLKKVKGDSTGDNAEKGGILPKSTSSTSLVIRGSMDAGKHAAPEEFVTYLRTEQKPEDMLVGKIHKLRQLLRNETVSWVETFIKLGGLTEIVGLLHRIMQVEWREDHEDQLLHEALLCLKALSTTDTALQKISEIEKTLFPALLGMLFDPENKGPSEFSTRAIITNILLAHLNAAVKTPSQLPERAKAILSYVSDPAPPEEKRPMPFILEMRQSRPYKLWHREVSNVSKEVFWIFLHHLNIIALPEDYKGSNTKDYNTAQMARNISAEQYIKLYFPRPRPPVPAAPYVGGVEWDATHYIAANLDLVNGLIASMPTREERNQLRRDLHASGWEKTMGTTLRTCKEKFYDCIHDGLRTWVAAAAADGWDVRDVRMGPPKVNPPLIPKKSPKKKEDKPPVLDAPKLDLKLGLGESKASRAQNDEFTQWL